MSLAVAPALCCLPLSAWFIPDTSGVQPTVLPSGPGSIAGMGESLQTQPNSGTVAYSIPFALPPGRAGFASSLGLQYNGDGVNGPLGLGWRINLPSIQHRADKGLHYDRLYGSESDRQRRGRLPLSRRYLAMCCSKGAAE